MAQLHEYFCALLSVILDAQYREAMAESQFNKFQINHCLRQSGQGLALPLHTIGIRSKRALRRSRSSLRSLLAPLLLRAEAFRRLARLRARASEAAVDQLARRTLPQD